MRDSRSTLRRIGLWTAAIVLITLIATGLLVARAFQAATDEETLRHQLVAERIFDEVEAELTELVNNEEKRSFLEYRFFYLPERQIAVPGRLDNPGLARSPLSTPPKDTWKVGYFQLDPDGSLSSPTRPRDNEYELACQAADYQPSPEDVIRETSVSELLSDVQFWEVPAVDLTVDEIWPVTRPNEYATQTLNRGAQKRSGRTTQAVRTATGNVAGFQDKDHALEQVIEDNFTVNNAGLQTNVEISPVVGHRLNDEDLVLYRTVRLPDGTYQQGLVVKIDGLANHLTDTVLLPSPLAQFATLVWSADVQTSGTWSFDHRFAPPFQDLEARVVLQMIPSETSSARVVIGSLAALLCLAVILGSLSLYRMTATEVSFAQRRTDFVSAVTHELKTPLTAIRMHGEMLRDGIVADESKRNRYYKTITSESERLSRLIDNVLELSRLERSTSGVRGALGSPNDALERAISVVEPWCRQQGAELSVQLEPSLPAVQHDPEALLQVVVNLVDNAVKFGDGRVVLSAQEADGGVDVVVRDHGPGVPPHHLKRIFEPFFRGERELTRTTNGTGIGLALVKGLVEEMRGVLSATNHAQGGFEVRVHLT